jgi:hypothetical protein
MARKIDYTKPLSEEDEAYLRQRLPNEQVDYLKARASGETTTQTRLLSELVGSDSALRHAEGARTGSDEEKKMQDGDDPADFTVPQVNAHLQTADEDERERVIEAEEDGEARKGILEA